MTTTTANPSILHYRPSFSEVTAPPIGLELMAVTYANEHDCEFIARPKAEDIRMFFVGEGLSLFLQAAIADRVVELCGGVL